MPEIINHHSVDTVIVGPVRGSMERILSGETGVIQTEPTNPDDMPKPARKEYFRDIPRMAKRYRKFMLSMLGCPWNCSYCSSSSGHISSVFGRQAQKDYFLSRRSIPTVIAEAKEIAKYDTHEIEWVDDDIFAGRDANEWLLEFADVWTKCVFNRSGFVDAYSNDQPAVMPMYVSTTSSLALKASHKVLKALRPFVNVIGMGIQAIRPESLRLFNRAWDNEKQMKDAYYRLTCFGYRVNLQAIVGLPVADPIDDALETIMAMQRIGPGSICSVYPLQIYPGTKMEKYCRENDIKLNPDCKGDTNNAVCAIDFPPEVQKQLKNICKLGTLFVKYNVGEKWMRLLIKIDFDEKLSQELSMLRYYECVTDRLGDKGERIFNDILSSMKIRF
jgi:radical SAM superfamily enzyme YgiQ (UPF0313 family)